MDRVFESGAAASPPSAPGSPSTGYATGGNPGGGTPATKPGPWWYHMITEELRAVIVAAGLTPSHTNLGQLASAIAALIPGIASTTETRTGALATKSVSPAGLAETMLGGVGQSWNDVTASRALSTTYTNSTGRPIFVSVSGSVNSAAEMSVLVNGVQVGKQTSPGGSVMCITAIVPPGATYRVQIGSGSLQTWFEMR